MFGRKKIIKPNVNNIKTKKILNHPVIRLCISHETDLVQVSSHNSVCQVCQKYEGKIFSITGSDDRFPLLHDVPPFCDSCRHNIYATFETALEVQHTLKQFIEFSNNKTEKHPTDKGYIPLRIRPKVDLGEEIRLRKKKIAIEKKIKTRIDRLDANKKGSTAFEKIEKEIEELINDKKIVLEEINSTGGWDKFIPGLKHEYKDLFSF